MPLLAKSLISCHFSNEHLGVQDNLQLMLIFFPKIYIPFFWAGEKKKHLKPKHGICDSAFCLKNKKDDLQVLGYWTEE